MASAWRPWLSSLRRSSVLLLLLVLGSSAATMSRRRLASSTRFVSCFHSIHFYQTLHLDGVSPKGTWKRNYIWYPYYRSQQFSRKRFNCMEYRYYVLVVSLKFFTILLLIIISIVLYQHAQRPSQWMFVRPKFPIRFDGVCV